MPVINNTKCACTFIKDKKLKKKTSISAIYPQILDWIQSSNSQLEGGWLSKVKKLPPITYGNGLLNRVQEYMFKDQ